MAKKTVGLSDKLICDDCGDAAQIVVSELISRGVDVLCWQCLMSRAVAVAAKILENEQGSEQSA